MRKYYAFAGQTVAMDDGDGLKYFLTDHLGSVLAVLDDAGAVLEQQRYLPFGAPRNLQGYSSIGLTDHTYTFQRNLPDMGLMDYRARFYSSYLNHFTQPDNIVPDPSNPQDWNRYSYTLNNPIRYNDPSGHMFIAEGDMKKGCSDPQYCENNRPKSSKTGDDDSNQFDTLGARDLNCWGEHPCISDGSILPLTATLHPLDGNVVSRLPIYDYSYLPPKPIGYTITSYAYDGIHYIDPWGVLSLRLPIPNLKQPVSFTNGNIVYSYGVKPIITGMINQLAGLGIAAACTLCGGVEVALRTASVIETVNNMYTFDTNIRTHDVYFSEPPILTPLDELPYHKIP